MKADNCIALLQQMVAIPSESQNEQAFAEFLANYLREELSMETQLQHVDGKSYNVIGRWNSSTHGKKLILGGHIDTVPPTPRWETNPYQLCTRGDELHGLGAADMKGGLAAQLTVLRRFKEENASFDADIEFVGLSDEERHSIGAHAYVKLMQQQNALRKKNFFLMGEPHFDNIVIGATGKALLSLHIQGKEGHASTPETGINAIDCMARFLTAVQEKYMPLYANGVCASYCCLKIESDYAGYSLTIPSKCSALMNKQLFPTESIDSFIDDLQRIYAEKVCVGNLTICREIPSYPAYQLSPEQSDVQRLTSLLRKQFGHAPELRINQSVSDGNILYNELRIPTVLFGPHGVAFHTECEYVKISSLSQYMDELYAFIKQEYTR